MAAAQHTGHLESLLAAANPTARFRNFGWEGDTVFRQPRDFNFPPLKEHLKQAAATLIVIQFGRIESLQGPEKINEFEAAYERLLDDFQTITPRIALVTPPRFERAEWLPDAQIKNESLQKYATAIRRIAEKRRLQVVDLTVAKADGLLTADGLQFTEYGHAVQARLFSRQASATEAADRAGVPDAKGRWTNPAFEQLRRAIQEKNRHWFNYWRPQNWAFLGGDRVTQPSSRDHRDPKVRWFPEEMKQFTSLIADAEAKIQTLANEIR